MPDRGSKQGGKYDRNLSELIIRPAEQGIPIDLGSNRSFFTLACLNRRECVIPPEGKHIPGQVFMCINNDWLVHRGVDDTRDCDIWRSIFPIGYCDNSAGETQRKSAAWIGRGSPCSN